MEVTLVGDASSLRRALGSAGKETSKFGAAAARAARVGGAALAGAGALSVKAASDFESAFAGVRKTVDATEKEYKRLSDGIRQMSREIPVAANELAGIAEAAGQLGIKKKNILEFIRTMADLGVATNLSGEEAATALARLANITQMSQGDFDNLGSTIVALGNNLATTEAEIVDMSLGLAATGKQVGLSQDEILAFSGALSSIGIEAEAGGSAMSKAFIAMAQASAEGGSKLDTFAKVAGVSSAEFKKRFETDAAGASIAFIEGLGKMGKEGKNVFAVLDDLGLSEVRVRKALLGAAGAGDLFSDSLAIGSKAWKDNNALTKEAEQRYATTASRLSVLKNVATDLAVTFGSVVLPPLADSAKAVAEFANQAIAGEGAGGRFRDRVVEIAQGVGDVGRTIGPTALGIGKFAFEVAKAGAEFARSREGMALLGTAAGALTGRLIGLGTAFAVGRIVAFGQAIATLGRQMALVAGTALIQMRTGLIGGAGLGAALGGMAGPIGILVGGLAGLGLTLAATKGSSDNTKVSVQQLTDALRAQADAAREVADIDVDVAQRRATVNAANLSVTRAERSLSQARKEYGRNSLEAKEAESALEQAKVQQERAQRDVSRAEEDGRGKRERLREETERSHDEISKHVSKLRDLEGKLRDEQKELRKTEALHGRNSTAAKIHRDKISELREQIGQLKSKKIDVEVALSFTGAQIGNLDLGPLTSGGRGRGSGGPELLGPIVNAGIKAAAQATAPKIQGGGAVGVGRWLQSLGYQVGEHPAFGGVRGKHAPNSFHNDGRAIDVNADGAPGGEARALDAIFPVLKALNPVELLWRVGGHFDHLHAAWQRGGLIPGTGSGDKIGALLEPGEGVVNKRAVRAFGGSGFIDALNGMVPRFQSGGVIGKVAGAARGAGFKAASLKNAIAVAMAESGGRLDARNYNPPVEDSQGPWQVNVLAHPWARGIKSMAGWAKAAFRISKGGKDWSPWSVWPRKAARFMAAARRAAIGSGRRGSGGGGGSGGGRSAPGTAHGPTGGTGPLGVIEEAGQALDLAESIAGLTPGLSDDRDVDVQRQALLEKQATAIRDRLKAIDDALKRKLRPDTRERLLEERTDLMGRLPQIISQQVERVNALREAFASLRSSMSDLATDAASKFRAGLEKGIDDNLKARLKAIQSSPIAQELASLLGTQSRLGREREDRQQERAIADARKALERPEARLARAKASGNERFIAVAQAGFDEAQEALQSALDAREDTLRARRIESLQGQLSDQEQAANDEAELWRGTLDKQEDDYRTGLEAQLHALVGNLEARRTTYAQFARDVNAILAPLGGEFTADPAHEVMLGAPGVGPGGKTAVPGKGVSWAVWRRWSQAERDRYRDRHRDEWSEFRPRRFGGPVKPGQSYLVGEAGVEVFEPNQPGRIVPNSRLRQGPGGIRDVNLVNNAPITINNQVDLSRAMSRVAFKIATGVR